MSAPHQGFELYAEYGDKGLTEYALDQPIRSSLSRWEEIYATQVRDVP